MKKHLIIAVVLIFALKLNAQQKVRVFYQNDKAISSYNFDKFKFAHNFFADAFYRTDLYKQLNNQEMAEIIETVRQKVSSENAVKFEILQNEEPNATLIFSVNTETKDGSILIMATNFDQDSRKFNEGSDQNLVRWYFIKEDKIVYRNDVYSKENEDKLIKEKDRKGLIDLYMFDDVSENDNKIKGLIDEILSDDKANKIEILYANLYLQEYYLSIKEFVLAEKANQSLNTIFQENVGKEIPSNYKLIPSMANSELEIMRLIK